MTPVPPNHCPQVPPKWPQVPPMSPFLNPKRLNDLLSRKVIEVGVGRGECDPEVGANVTPVPNKPGQHTQPECVKVHCASLTSFGFLNFLRRLSLFRPLQRNFSCAKRDSSLPCHTGHQRGLRRTSVGENGRRSGN